MVRMNVEVVAGRGLAGVDRGGTSDPFVTVGLADESRKKSRKTSVVKKNLAPTWNQKFDFESIGTLRFRVYDWNMLKSKPMGEALVDPKDGFDDWVALKPFDKMEAAAGEIHLKITINDNAQAAADNARWFQDVEDESGKEPNTLLIAVVRARGLRAVDGSIMKTKKSSDPFVVAKLGSAKKKTKVVSKDLNPVWMESFEFPLLKDEPLLVTVLDKNTLGSDTFLGSVQVVPTTRQGWFPLADKKGQAVADRGQVELVLKLAYDPANDSSEDREFFEEEIEQGKPNEVRIAVCRARGLLAKDPALPFSSKGATSDPYVVVRFQDKQIGRTKALKQTLAPVWNQVYSFDYEGTKLSDIEFKVMDHDMVGSDDFLGFGVVPLLADSPAPRRQWLQLGEMSQRAGGDGSFGQLLVVVQWRYSRALDFSPFSAEVDDSRPPNELCVALFRGRDLATKDRSSKSSDPRVRFKLSGCGNDIVEWKSTTRKKTLDPVWREVYAKHFLWHEDHPEKPTLRLECEDVDELTSADSMGFVELPLVRGTTMRGWHPLLTDSQGSSSNVSGELHVTVQWRYNSAYDFDPWSGIVESPDKTPNELRVGLVRGRNLAIKDKPVLYGTGSSDPRMVFSLGDSKWKSKVVKKSLEPSWCEMFVVAYNDEKKLGCMCEDWDEVTKADFMGAFDVELSTTRTRRWYSLTADERSSNVSGEIELITVLAYNPALDFDPWADEEPSDGEPNELCLALVRGRSLAIKDKPKLFGSGSSDPRITFSIKDEVKARSKTIKKSLDPSWCETFTIPLVSDPEMFGANGPILRVVCEDVDEMSKADFMGQIDIQLAPGRRSRDWHKLQGGESSSNVSGELELVVFWRHNKSLDFEPFLEDDVYKDKPPNELRIGLVQGRDLAVKDKPKLYGEGSSDPRVRFRVDGKECGVSTTQFKTLNPTWRETFSFAQQQQTSQDKLLLTVLCEDVDEMTSADDMGMVEIEVEPHDRVRKWYSLVQGRDTKKASSNVRGQLEIITQHWYNPAHDFDPFLDSDEKGKDPNEVRIALIQGRNLAAKDKNMLSKNSSDPFVTFKLGHETFKSNVVSKSLNPVWRQIFQFPLENAERLECTCEDYDAVSSSDYMGEFSIDLGTLEPGKKLRKWYSLTTTEGKSQNVSGEIELVVQRWYNQAIDFDPFEEDVSEAGLEPNEVRIALVRGRGLAVKDKYLLKSGGSSDPRVRFQLTESIKCTSSTQHKTLSPNWCETFTMPYTRLGPDPPVLNVFCEDVDEATSADFMGSLRIPLEEKTIVRKWYALQSDAEGSGLKASSNVTGEIELIIQWRHNQSLNFSPFGKDMDESGKPPNELRVGLIQGRALSSKNKKVDPVVRFTVGKLSFESTVKKDTSDPTWNEVFEKSLASTTEPLEVSCGDWNALTKRTSLGTFTVPLEPLLVGKREAKRAWYSVSDKGSIELWTQFRYNPALDFTPFTDTGTPDGKKPNELRIGLSMGRNLAAKDSASILSSKRATSDPRVTFSLGTLKATSTTKKKKLDPVWREIFALECEEEEDAVLHCVCEDVNTFSSPTKIGEFDLPLKGLPGGVVDKQWYSLGDAAAGEVEIVLHHWYNPEHDWAPFSSFEKAEKPPNEVHIGISRGRRLKPMDGKTSDPRVRLEFPGEKKRLTKHKPKTLNPVWREQFQFAVTKQTPLTLVCEDYDCITSADEIGRCVIQLDPPSRSPSVTKKWYSLGDDRGEIQVVVAWRYNQVADFDPFTESSPEDKKKPPNELRIGLSQARELAVKDKPLLGGGGSSDPRMRFNLFTPDSKTSLKSTTKKKTLNPSWKEVFQIPTTNATRLECICEDVDTMSAADFMGRFDIELAPYADQSIHRSWYALQDGAGEVELVIQWRYNSIYDYDPFDDDDDDVTKSPNELRVALVAGRGLAAKDTNLISKKSSDPRMRFTVGKVSFESHVKKQTLEPVWRETWSIPLDDGDVLSCSCEDYDALSKADPMGTFEVPLMPLQKARKCRQWFELSGGTGSIDLIVQWRYNKNLDFQPFADGSSGKKPNELRIGLSRGRNLPVMDKGTLGVGAGLADPRVKFMINGSVMKSSTKKQTLEPKWFETFDTVLFDSSVLECVCEDVDTLSTDEIGRFQIDVESLIDQKVTKKWYPLERGGDIEVVLQWHYNPLHDYDPFSSDDNSIPPGASPNELRVALVRGRNLAAQDSNLLTKNSSDPRMRFSVRGSDEIAFESHVKKQSLDPLWKETWSIEFEGEECILDCRCEDWDAMSRADPMGHFEVSVVGDGSPVRKFYQLVDGTGEIELITQWRFNPALDFSPFATDDSKKKPNELRIGLSRAKGLDAKDASFLGGKRSSDPRCTLKIATKAFKSTTKKKTLEPVWKESFALPLDDKSQKLVCVCEDVDTLSSADLIGRCEIDLAEVLEMDGKAKKQWYHFEGGGGQVELVLQWRYNPIFDYDPFDDDDNESEGGEANELRVALVRGCGLAAKDKNLLSKNSSDPRVRFAVKNTTIHFQSHVKRQTLDPIWKETWTRPLEASAGDYVLECLCEDWDEISQPDAMGRFEVPLVPGKKVRAWYELEKDGGGSIELIVQWHYNPAFDWRPFSEEDDERADAPPNELRIGLAQARGLEANDTNFLRGESSSDPRVRFELHSGNQPRKLFTSTSKTRTVDPVWRETFSCDVSSLGKRGGSRKDTLICFCEDVDSLSSADPMGSVAIDLWELADKKLRRQWYDLDNGTGSLQLVLHWRTNASLLFEPFGESDEHPDRTPNELRVAVVQGRALAARDAPWLGGSPTSDPRVIVECGQDVRFVTETKQRTLNPRWTQVFSAELLFDSSASYQLCARCEDVDTVKNDLIGSIENIDLATLSDHRVWRDWCALNNDGQHCGSIELAVQWWYNPAFDFEPFDAEDDDIHKPANELRLALVRGRNLPIMDRNLLSKGGSTDARAVFVVSTSDDDAVDVTRLQSKVKRRTLAPTWREQWVVPLSSPKTYLVSCTVEDYDDMSSPDKIGDIAPIALDRLERGKVHRGWHALKDEGEIELIVHWRHNPATSFDAFLDLAENPDNLPPNELRIAVVQIRGMVSRPESVSINSEHLDKPLAATKQRLPEIVAAPCTSAKSTLDLSVHVGDTSCEVSAIPHERSRDWYEFGDGGEVELIINWRYNPQLDNDKRLKEVRDSENERTLNAEKERRARGERLESERKERVRRAAEERARAKAARDEKESIERARREEARRLYEQQQEQQRRARAASLRRRKKLEEARRREEEELAMIEEEERRIRREELARADRERAEAAAAAKRKAARDEAKRLAMISKSNDERREAARAARQAADAELRAVRDRRRSEEFARLKAAEKARAEARARAKSLRLRQEEASRAEDARRRADEAAFRDRLEHRRKKKLAEYTRLRLEREAQVRLQREHDLADALQDPSTNWAPPRFSKSSSDFLFVKKRRV